MKTCLTHPEREATVGRRCRECYAAATKAVKLALRKRVAEAEGRTYKPHPPREKRPPRPCKACGQAMPSHVWAYCSDACKAASRVVRATRRCTNCDAPALKNRDTCSDVCAAARQTAHLALVQKVGLRSETVRARRRKEKASRYRGSDKAEVIERLTREQGGMCASCGEAGTTRGLVLDHDHRTGVARGMLCGRCNAALGLLLDSPERVRKLHAYALKWSAQTLKLSG